VYDPNKLEKAHVILQVLGPGTFTLFVLHLVRLIPQLTFGVGGGWMSCATLLSGQTFG
jgi:hypothetical protein